LGSDREEWNSVLQKRSRKDGKIKQIHSHYYPVYRTGSHSAYDILSVLVDGAAYLLRELMIVGAGVLVGEAPDIHGMEANRRRR
jgi:hypothetical protein